MNLRAGAILGGSILSALLWKGCNDLHSETDTAPIAPVTSDSGQTDTGLDKDSDSKKVRNTLKRLLSGSVGLIDEEDPCLETSKDYLEVKADEASGEDLKELKDHLEACKAALTSEASRVTLRNFNILESQGSYDKSCGGEKAVECLELQEELRREVESKGLTGWTYSSEIEWAYDENGQIIDVKAFPGYQQYVNSGGHEDLLSLSAQMIDGAPVYGVAISCHKMEGGTEAVFSGQMKSAEAVGDYVITLQQEEQQ